MQVLLERDVLLVHVVGVDALRSELATQKLQVALLELSAMQIGFQLMRENNCHVGGKRQSHLIGSKASYQSDLKQTDEFTVRSGL